MEPDHLSCVSCKPVNESAGAEGAGASSNMILPRRRVVAGSSSLLVSIRKPRGNPEWKAEQGCKTACFWKQWNWMWNWSVGCRESRLVWEKAQNLRSGGTKVHVVAAPLSVWIGLDHLPSQSPCFLSAQWEPSLSYSCVIVEVKWNH